VPKIPPLPHSLAHKPVRVFLWKCARALTLLLGPQLSFPLPSTILFSFFKQCLRSCKTRGVNTLEALECLQGLLVVQITSGTDYYLCAPPGVIFPSTDPQQSDSNLQQPLLPPHILPLPPTTMPSSTEASHGSTEAETDSTDTQTVTAQDSPTQRETLLQEFSPNQLQFPQQLPTTTYPQQKVPPDLKFKPLGRVGQHPIPQHILQALQPQHNTDIQPNPDPKPYQLQPPYPYAEAMQELLQSLPSEVIKLIPPEDYQGLTPLYHASAFLLPKISSNKLSLILNLRAWNKSQDHLPPKFKLPTVYSLRHKLLLAALADKPMFFTTWDLKNFYWAMKGPIFRFATVDSQSRLQVWQLDAVPFGWDKACFVGQTTHLAAFSGVPKPPETDADVYIDDGLGSGADEQLLNTYTAAVMDELQQQGFPISEKSHPIASQSQNYIGKHYQSREISNTSERSSKILLLYAITVCAPYLSHTYLERVLGISIYGVSHNSGYSHAAFLRVLVDKKKTCTATPYFRTSLASLWAQCFSPWHISGFFPIQQQDSPRIYIDAGPHLIGLVFQLQGHWKSMSVPLGKHERSMDLEVRQQASELFGVLAAVRICLDFSIHKPTFVLDSSSAFYACIKGSTKSSSWVRMRTLQKISVLVQRNQFLAFLQMINTKFHPADIPSRTFHPLQPAPQNVMARLFHIATHPTLVQSQPQAYVPDCSRDAWSTPNWLRWFIMKSAHPPTIDLYADHTNALAPEYFDLQHPLDPLVTPGHTAFFQPPYAILQPAWQQCLALIPSLAGLWGLVPCRFYHDVIKLSIPTHICTFRAQVNYQHPTLQGDRASFKSTLFYIPAIPTIHNPHPPCHCHYLSTKPPTPSQC